MTLSNSLHLVIPSRASGAGRVWRIGGTSLGELVSRLEKALERGRPCVASWSTWTRTLP